MIKSMTGYGRAAQTIGGREITVEIRSVNNRYLDCSVKLPRVFGFAEDAVERAREGGDLARQGRRVHLGQRRRRTREMKISLNRPVLEGYLAALNTIAKDYGVPNDVTVTSLARMPDVFVVEKQEEDEKQITADILSVANEAIGKYGAMRTVEGAALEADLRAQEQDRSWGWSSAWSSAAP